MERKELFSIGEVGELFGINIRTLRYYDSIGLLRPEYVNPENGYRYYCARQFERLNTIQYLRALNMPLERIKAFFENKDARAMESLLEEQLNATRQQLDRLRGMERRILRRLEGLRYAMGAEQGKVRERVFEPRPAAYLRQSIRQTESLEYPIRELERLGGLGPAMFLGKVGVSIGREDLEAGRLEKFSGIFVLLEEEDGFQGQEGFLPGGMYLTILYSGTHQESGPYYRRIFERMEREGLALSGDSVEVTWIDAGLTEDMGQYVTELQVPVRKKEKTD